MMMFAFMSGIKKDCDLTLASIFSPLVGCGQCVDSWGKKRFVCGLFWFSVKMMMMKPHPHWLSLLGSEAALPCWWRSSPESFCFIQTIVEHNFENTYELGLGQNFHHHDSITSIIITITFTLSPDLTSLPLRVHLHSGAGSPTTGIERSSCWFTCKKKVKVD